MLSTSWMVLDLSRFAVESWVWKTFDVWLPVCVSIDNGHLPVPDNKPKSTLEIASHAVSTTSQNKPTYIQAFVLSSHSSPIYPTTPPTHHSATSPFPGIFALTILSQFNKHSGSNAFFSWRMASTVSVPSSWGR
jgi:hypothetical protein